MSTTVTAAEPAVVMRLAQADLLMLLAELLRGPTDGVGVATWPVLLAAAGAAEDAALAAAWRALAERTAQTPRALWAVEHTRLFEGALACPPNQTAWVRRDKGVVLGDLCGFYRAFQLSAPSSTGEKPDHVVTQLQFLAVLLVLAAQAEAAGQVEQAQVTADAARAFADDHLSPWLGLFAGQLQQASALPLLHDLAAALAATWAALAPRHRWAPWPSEPAAPPAPEVDPPSDACGSIAADPLVPLQVRGVSPHTSVAPATPSPKDHP